MASAPSSDVDSSDEGPDEASDPGKLGCDPQLCALVEQASAHCMPLRFRYCRNAAGKDRRTKEMHGVLEAA